MQTYFFNLKCGKATKSMGFDAKSEKEAFGLAFEWADTEFPDMNYLLTLDRVE